MYRLVQLLKHVKLHLKTLDGDIYKQLEDQIMSARNQLDMAQKKLHDDPLNATVQVAAQAAQETYVSLNQKHLSLLNEGR